jgi:hypothetical protein
MCVCLMFVNVLIIDNIPCTLCRLSLLAVHRQISWILVLYIKALVIVLLYSYRCHLLFPGTTGRTKYVDMVSGFLVTTCNNNSLNPRKIKSDDSNYL